MMNNNYNGVYQQQQQQQAWQQPQQYYHAVGSSPVVVESGNTNRTTAVVPEGKSRHRNKKSHYPDAFIENKKKANPTAVPDNVNEIEEDYHRQQLEFTPGCPAASGRRRHQDVEDNNLRDKLKGCKRGKDDLALAANYNFVPFGMKLSQDFITQSEEQKILLWVEKIGASGIWESSLLRRTQQFGYKFAHLSSSLIRADEGMPLWTTPLLQRGIDNGLFTRMPNQLIINEYDPGQGINSHSDQHCFEDDIVVVSLGSPVTINWTNGSDYIAEKFGISKKEMVQIIAQPRSLMSFTSMARWRWQHSIAGVEKDISEDGKTFHRTKRVSLTFRYVDPQKWAKREQLLSLGENSIDAETGRYGF